MEKSYNDILRDQAVSEVVKEKPSLVNHGFDFIKRVGQKFVEKQVQNFPNLCEIARVQNIMEFKKMEQVGTKGRFTETYGWSQDRNFKFDYQIPNELYAFMTNMVHPQFWSEENERVWRKFMKRICDGHDPYDALYKAKLKF